MSSAFLRRQATRAGPIPFRRGDLVEVASVEEGFVGSYYEAMVVTHIGRGDYVVQYATLVKDDFSGPLTDVATGAEIRPTPPRIRVGEFRERDVVDAFDNDGWWVGRITGRVAGQCRVFFDSTGDEIWYPNERLRFHHDWVGGRWVCDRDFSDRGVGVMKYELGNRVLNQVV